GNYKLVCLVHEGMTGTVHVLDPSLPLPHDQAYYDRVAAATRHDLLADRHDNRSDNDGAMNDADESRGQQREVTAGGGSISATPGGQQAVSVMRFMQSRVEIRAGGTVEWNNVDPATPHTITFGTEPDNPAIPVNVTPDADGGLSATITSPSDSANSGLIVASGLERVGVAVASLNPTHFRVTFPHAGTYPYKCALHDNLGMKGVVVVRP
ncbi:MAG: plastocyanin/azurin family copper-binding protein, partial [Dokdonella sp.]